AQAAAASLSASLEVLSRFTALSLQSGPRSPLEERITEAISQAAPEPPLAPARPAPSIPVPRAAAPEPRVSAPEPASFPPPRPPIPQPSVEADLYTTQAEPSSSEFDINQLTPEEQELHRRANRVAKVSMQDIKMLRPEQVRLGRENRDICTRLKDDIEKAH